MQECARVLNITSNYLHHKYTFESLRIGCFHLKYLLKQLPQSAQCNSIFINGLLISRA